MFSLSELGLAVVVGQGQHEDRGHTDHRVQLGNHVSLLSPQPPVLATTFEELSLEIKNQP